MAYYNTFFGALKNIHFWHDVYTNIIDDWIGFAVLCVACVILLSYLRERPPEFEKKRIIRAGVVLLAGAVLVQTATHYSSQLLDYQNLKPIIVKKIDHLPADELNPLIYNKYKNQNKYQKYCEDTVKAGNVPESFNSFLSISKKITNDDLLISASTNLFVNGVDLKDSEDQEIEYTYQKYFLILNVYTTMVGFVAICAGAFILMGIFRAKHIATMAGVQLLGFFLRAITKEPYGDFVGKIYTLFFKESLAPKLIGYNGFFYGCFMVIMIILYIIITKRQYENFWTKDINVVKHILFLISMFFVYMIMILIYTYSCNFISGFIDDVIKNIKYENQIKIIIDFLELIIYTFLATVLLYVPKRTYTITRSELQGDFYDVKRKEEVELYSQSEARIKAERKYIHDLPGHFRTISSMAEEIGADNISQYVQELDEELIKSKGEFSTGNSSLDNFLCDKLKNAQKHDINIVFNGVFPDKGIRKIDMTTIFHNLIENAIEACKDVQEKREIVITSKIHEDRVYVSFSNPFGNKIHNKQGKIETIKKNKAFHGYGLSSVEGVVKKREYDGSFSTRQEDNIFTAEVNLRFKR